MNSLSSISTASMPVGAPEPPKPKDAGEAAKQFEALLLAQMMRSARSEEERQDSTLDTMWDMAAQQFAQVMADSGGLGLASMIRHNLASVPAVSNESPNLPKEVDAHALNSGGI